MKKILFSIYLIFTLSLTTIALETPIVPVKYLTEGFADIVEPLMPAVVNIYTSRTKKNLLQEPSAPDNFYKFFEQFDFPFGFEELHQDPKASAVGSGFIIDPAGYIVTNHHLIENSEEINVKLNDNTEVAAQLIGSDPRTDLALLKVDFKTPLPSVAFGNSGKARVGDIVIAIGNPFGLGGTVTTGIISSKSRDINATGIGIVDNFIQTDAAINVGNSGGPMFNIKGEVIGVNTAILAPSGNNIGIGFAIPSSTVQHVIEQLKKNGRVSRGFLGIKIQPVTPQIAEAINLDEEEGVLVVEADPKGAGSKAGLKAGDVIINIGDVKVTNSRKLQILVADAPLNSIMKITVLRHGLKKELECKMIEEIPSSHLAKDASQKPPSSIDANSFQIHGIVFVDKVEESSSVVSKAVVIDKILQQSDWKGLVKGDHIMSVNQSPISSVKEFEEIYNKAIKGDKKHIVFFIKRHNSKLFLALPL